MFKKVFILSMFMLLLFPFSAMATVSGFNIDDYPSIDSLTVPDGYEYYVMSWHPDKKWEADVCGYWKIYFVDDPSLFKVKTVSPGIDYVNIASGNYVCESMARIKYDNVLEEYYITGWSPTILEPSEIGGTTGVMIYINHNDNFLAYNSDVLYTDDGNFYLDAHPFPDPPPVVANLVGASLANLNGIIGYQAKEVLSIGLSILALILVIFLVPLLIKSLVLYRK